MTIARHVPRSGAAGCSGFGLLDSVIAVMLVGILMVGSLQTIGASKRRETATLDRLLAQQLSGAMMNEILLQSYNEPETDEAVTFGLEPNESTGDRSQFDDVDDFHGWVSTPPQSRNGMTIPGFSQWTRSVDVSWADPATLEATAAVRTGLKKIRVTVAKSGRVINSLVSYRSIGWVETIPSPSDATGNHAPVAVATSPDLSRDVGETTEFAADASSDQDGDYLSYVWDFGDGNTGTGITTTHRYNSPGNFTCTLTVYDGRGGVGVSALTAVISL
ncbi:Microbial collagenase precursor [Novipirellula galeiformis]|uniref:Microbial collagenase n=1 Tax=Novipirellula galeiformis TaxID=2528004 RepID=A0A5C6CBZ8_9BACT|nr:PKD domain-containing protein [Novipirellula galeiformis]TWU20971.1 Microbial collagenase precursor [Novipirellula galeiformis]